MDSASATSKFHPLPVIGYPEAHYLKHAQQAEAAGDMLAKAGYKVGQYITLAIQPNTPWEQRLKCFRHALKHYCCAAPDADKAVTQYCDKLRDLVRRHAALEALKSVSKQHDEYLMRAELGVDKETLTEEAELFFPQILGHAVAAPEWCTPEAWERLTAMRNHWV